MTSQPHTPTAARVRTALLSLGLAATALLTTACGSAAPRPSMSAEMAPIAMPDAPAQPLVVNHFTRDKVGTVSEDHIREILAAPAFLEADARIGVVPVETGYELDHEVPLTQITGLLADRLTDAGLFEVVSEVTTDWPGTRSVAGLREIATRYRAEYLLLYRHRFVDFEHTNGWGWTWLAVLPALVVPANTLEVNGVLEATLFDVKSGTLLFTVYERVGGEEDRNAWNQDRKRRHMKRDLLAKAADGLINRVDGRLRDLVAARPDRNGLPMGKAPAAPASSAPESRRPEPQPLATAGR